MKKKFCVITSSRSDYGLLKPFLEKANIHEKVELQLIVTGSHLASEFGHTYKEIENDGFEINEKIETLLNSDTPVAITKSMGLALISFSEAYNRIRPDVIVVMGDRYEIFSAVAAAHVNQLPVAHLSGGEVTTGAIDDAFRHSITKMSHLHFTSIGEYRNRVIQLGENPETVFDVGEIGLEEIKRYKLMTKSELKNDLKFEFNLRNLLITFHPVTLENNTSKRQFENLLHVLSKRTDTNMIFTKTNADTFGRVINRMLEDYVKTYPQNSLLVTSLGRLRYLSLLQFVDAVVGNSSSGIIEAPSFQIGTINIGDRQNGRVKTKSVIDCPPTKNGINSAFKKLYSPNFQKILCSLKNPYESQDGSKIILEVTLDYLKTRKDIKKEFFDISVKNI
jgi:GDP/UDP-N,N'-diacetylbacillosamine 2-epimerase (hydrolysing)